MPVKYKIECGLAPQQEVLDLAGNPLPFRMFPMRTLHSRFANCPSYVSSRGLTRVEVVVAGGIICLVLSMVVMVLPRSRELSKRLTCASNLSGISKPCKIYAQPIDVTRGDIPSLWPAKHPAPASKIKYTVPVGGGRGTPASPDRTQPCRFGPGGAEEVSLTRFFWMMLRSGDAQPKDFICPSSGDMPDPTVDIEQYYDFSGYRHVSYGC